MSGDQTNRQRITVVVVDNHAVVRHVLSDSLNAQPDIDVIGQAGTLEQAQAIIAQTNPDIAVISKRLPDGPGVELVRLVSTMSPTTRCILHTPTHHDIDDNDALAAGAAAIVLKNLSGTQLIDTIRRAPAY